MLRSQLPTHDLLFITLTLRPEGRSLDHLLSLLQTCFTRLRRLPVWRNNVAGGAAFLEIKRSKSVEGWNVHLHALVDSTWVPHHALRQAWCGLTGGSFIVDVRRVRDPDHVRRYVTKYVSKGFSSEVARNPEHLDEAIQALSGRRMCATFGTWRGIPLTWKPDLGERPKTSYRDGEPDDTPGGPQLPAAGSNSRHMRENCHLEAKHQPGCNWWSPGTVPALWIPIGSLSKVIEDAAAGDEFAYSLMKALDLAIYKREQARHTFIATTDSLTPEFLSSSDLLFADLGMKRGTVIARLTI